MKDGPFPDHYGGELSFGPVDGYTLLWHWYWFGIVPDSLGQDLSVLRGKLLRIDVETGAPATYTIPPTNPYASTANARPEIWATGLRNPWRSSFDRATGDYYIADVGQAAREEVDFQPADSGGGANYGWDIMEGKSLCFDATTCDTTGLTLPATDQIIRRAAQFRAAQFTAAHAIPACKEFTFWGLGSGEIWGLQPLNGVWQNSILHQTTMSIISFTEDEVGKLWVADYTGGGVYPIQEGASVPVDLSVTQSDVPDPCPAGNLRPTQSTSGTMALAWLPD